MTSDNTNDISTEDTYYQQQRREKIIKKNEQTTLHLINDNNTKATLNFIKFADNNSVKHIKKKKI